MESDQLIEEHESPPIFGDLYEWSKCSISPCQITSLLISDNIHFTCDDLNIICDISPLQQLFLHNLLKLDNLPPTLAKLRMLKVLSITHCNSLVVLPLVVRFLFNLETLRLDCPNLTELPGFLCLMPSLNLLLLRKSISICNQCKQHPKKSIRIIILEKSENCSFDKENIVFHQSVLRLSVLAANSYISYFPKSLFYQNIPLKVLWSSFESALALKTDRCIICLSSCSKNKEICISFTRLLNCKCVHLTGFICSIKCYSDFHNYLSKMYSNVEIFTSEVTQNYQYQINREEALGFSIGRRFKKILSSWTTCMPLRHKKSYTVNAN